MVSCCPYPRVYSKNTYQYTCNITPLPSTHSTQVQEGHSVSWPSSNKAGSLLFAVLKLTKLNNVIYSLAQSLNSMSRPQPARSGFQSCLNASIPKNGTQFSSEHMHPNSGGPAGTILGLFTLPGPHSWSMYTGHSGSQRKPSKYSDTWHLHW